MGSIQYIPGIIFLIIGSTTLAFILPHADFSYSSYGPDDLTIVIFGAILVSIGIFYIAFTFVRLRRRASIAKEVLETGIETEGTITFVDRNYSVKINGRYIYSIVEYKFTDSKKEYIKKAIEANTDEIVRCKIEVGGKVKIKYLPDDPTQSVIILPTGGIVA